MQYEASFSRAIDSKQKVDAIAPVVTSEAVTLNLLDRLGNGVAGNATFDVIRLYDLRLQKLVSIKLVE